MERLNVRILLLELTRQCNLECMHCFRGDSENKYMNEELLEKVFSNIARINTLLLTGGEPLIAVNQINAITNILKQDKININEFIIVTNGTVLTDELINMFFIINEKTNFQIKISTDKFHLLELQKHNLQQIKEKNISFLKQYFNVDEELPNDKVYIIDKVGRAANLTKEDIDYINSIGDNKVKYILGSDRILEKFRETYPLPKLIEDNVVDGSLNIDVYGNITPTYYSFKSEDENIYSNVRGNKTLKKAISNIKSM